MVWPREFYHDKIPVTIPRFLLVLRKKKTPSFDSPWFGLSYGAFAIVYSSLVTLFERSEFLIDTPHKKNLRVCPRARVK